MHNADFAVARYLSHSDIVPKRLNISHFSLPIAQPY